MGDGARYKFEIRTQTGELRLKADPVAFAAEMPPDTASVVFAPAARVVTTRRGWSAARERDPQTGPMSVYEVHLGSWRLNPLQGNRCLTYEELADELAAYVTDLGFTHVELLPVMAYPFSGSWGYQVTSYYAPTPRFGSPDDFRAFVDRLHQAGLGVILDWVPAHFPRDDWALARFDGTALYEHADPRRGSHPDWGTLVFNFGRNEVRNFLLANALFWLREYHADGLRVDAVASMLYLDYSRKAGEWIPNQFGGREDLEAVAFLKEMNEVVHAREPGVISAAEESTAWPGVSKPTYVGGLGFGFKWNMGWMHDTLGYFQEDPVNRRYHHHELTFSLMYAFSENFVLPLSHDEVVHGKGSLLSKMPGDKWQKLANLRCLYAYMWAHPGKKLLFMGGELAQEQEWSHERSLDWHLLEDAGHAGMQSLVRDLNHVYRDQAALWERDFEGEGFWWLEANDADRNVVAFAAPGPGRRHAAGVRVQPVAGAARGLPRRAAAAGSLGRGAQHRRLPVRRVGHGQPRRRRRRADALARPAVLGAADAAAAGRPVAGPPEVSDAQELPFRRPLGATRRARARAGARVGAQRRGGRGAGGAPRRHAADRRGAGHVGGRGAGRPRRRLLDPARRQAPARPVHALAAARAARPLARVGPRRLRLDRRRAGARRRWPTSSSTSCTSARSPPRAPSTPRSRTSPSWPSWASTRSR